MSESDSQTNAAAERMRRLRARMKSGSIIAHVEIPASIAEDMTRLGLVPEPDITAYPVNGQRLATDHGKALVEYIRRLRKRA